MRIIYNLGIKLYLAAIVIVSLFNKKAKQWLQGRRGLLERIKKTYHKNSKTIWIHCASLGEFEQGRPLIEKIKSLNPDFSIVLTFFSPSGYEMRKNYPGADYVFYLPMDGKKNAATFVNLIQPDVVFFIKYEFWFHYLNEIKKRDISCYLISAIFRANQHFFKWYGGWYRKILHAYKIIFTQDQNSKMLLKSINIEKVIVSGDTRADRVIQIASLKEDIPILKQFTNNQKVFICGSTWLEDEKLLIPLINQDKENVKFIIAPHEIKEEKIKRIQKLITKKTIRYTQAKTNSLSSYPVMILDTMGMLSKAYQYGFIAYVGGAFGKGLHNILEPAAFGLPVIFGKNYRKFNEAKTLIKREGCFSVKNLETLRSEYIQLLSDIEHYKKAQKAVIQYLDENSGATELIVERTSLR